MNMNMTKYRSCIPFYFQFNSFNLLLFSFIYLIIYSANDVTCKITRKLLPSPDEGGVGYLDVVMPAINGRNVKSEDYMCSAVKMPNTIRESFVIEFEPHADQERVHHMLLFGCSELYDPDMQQTPKYWNCGHSKLCHGMTIIYAWGKNAPVLKLPRDVGFMLGGTTNLNYVILQVHYAHTFLPDETDSSGLTLHYTFSPQKYLAGIHLLSSNVGAIPPRKQKYSIDVNCLLGGSESIFPFAYRVHAHSLGVVITGYKYNLQNNSWTFLAKGNPQWPQAFYPMKGIIGVSHDDILAARCTYNSSQRNHLTIMGSTSSDEMCNLYLMYYTVNPTSSMSARSARPSFGTCIDVKFPDLTGMLPAGSDEALPPDPNMEGQQQGGFHHYVSASHAGSESKSNNKDNSYDRNPDENQDHPENFAYIEVDGWPIGAKLLGQVTAVDVDREGRIIVFHRGNHVWNERSFDPKNKYKLIDEGAIAVDTIITIDPKTKQFLRQWGSNLFYLPHGLTIDHQSNSLWLTDVALHQIFKYPIEGSVKPLMTIGDRFIPGNGELKFCKPTSVAVSVAADEKDRDIYVADGYCNSRIIRFNHEGKFLNQWGHSDPIGYFLKPPPSAFDIPHKVVLIENTPNSDENSAQSSSQHQKAMACVADREHGRIKCFRLPHGEFQFEIEREEFNGRLFSLTYSHKTGMLYAVCGPSLFIEDKKEVLGFVFKLETQELMGIFAPNSGSFNQPHDIAVSMDGNNVFVVEIGPNNIYKFSREAIKRKITNSKLSLDGPNSSDKSTFKLKSPDVMEGTFYEVTPRQQSSHNVSSSKSIAANSNKMVSNQEIVQSAKMPQMISTSIQSSSIAVSLLVIPVILLVMIAVFVIVCRRQKGGNNGRCNFSVFKGSGKFGGKNSYRSQEKYDLGLGRLMKHPVIDVFNRVPNDDNSDLEANSEDDDMDELNSTTTSTKKGLTDC